MKRIHFILLITVIIMWICVALFYVKDSNRPTIETVPDEAIAEMESEYIDEDPREVFRHPEYVKIIDGEVRGYFDISGELDWVNLVRFEVFADYVSERGFKEVTINILSSGGLTTVAWEICSLMGQMSRRGITVTTQVRSFCGSAAFMIFVAGDNRLIEPTALLMIHKIGPHPDSKAFIKEGATPLAMFQNIIDVWMVAQSKITIEELKEKIDKGDWWFSGKDAVERWGFADGYIK